METHNQPKIVEASAEFMLAVAMAQTVVCPEIQRLRTKAESLLILYPSPVHFNVSGLCIADESEAIVTYTLDGDTVREHWRGSK